MANIGAFSQGFTSGFNLVDAAFARRAQRQQQERVFNENQRRWDIQNTRAQETADRQRTQWEQQQEVLAQEKAGADLARAYANGDINQVLQNPAVVQEISRRVEEGTGTKFDGFQVNDDGSITPLVSGMYPDGTPFQAMPATHGGVPMASAGEPITISAEELVNIGHSGLPLSSYGQAAITGAAAHRMSQAGQAAAPQASAEAPAAVMEPQQEPLQVQAQPTGPEGNLVQQAAQNAPAGQIPEAFLPQPGEHPMLSMHGYLESNFGQADTSKPNSVGAVGPFQVTESAEKDVERDIGGELDRMNPEHNRFIASHYSKMIEEQGITDPLQAAAAYHSGPSRVKRLTAKWGDAPTEATDINGNPVTVPEWASKLGPAGRTHVARAQTYIDTYGAPGSAPVAGEGVQLASADPGEVAQTAAQAGSDPERMVVGIGGEREDPTFRITTGDIQRQLDDYRATVGPMPTTQKLVDRIRGKGNTPFTSRNVGLAVGENLRGMSNILGSIVTDVGDASFEGLVKPPLKFFKAVGEGIMDSAKASKQATEDFAVGVVDGVAGGDPEYIPTYLKASGSNKAQNARSEMATESIQGGSAPVGTAAAETVKEATLNTPVTGAPNPTKHAAAFEMFNRQLNSGRRNIPTPVYGIMPMMVQMGFMTKENINEWFTTGTISDPRTQEIIKGLNSVDAGETFYVNDGQGGVVGITKPGNPSMDKLKKARELKKTLRADNEEVLKRAFMAYYPGEGSEENAERLLDKLATDMVRSERFSWDVLNTYDEEELIRFGQNYLQADTVARYAADPGWLGTIGNMLDTSAGWLKNLPHPKEDPTFYNPDGLWMLHVDVRGGEIKGVPSQPTELSDGVMAQARKVRGYEIPGLRDELRNSGDPTLANIGETGTDSDVAVYWAAWQMGARERSLPAMPGRR